MACGPNEELAEVPEVSRITLAPAAIIGELDGEEEYTFGDIRSIAVDGAGRVYVGDRIGATVRVYSPTGEFIEEIAREGEGPGEVYGWPADLTFGPTGNLYIRDASSVIVFGPSGGEGVADSLLTEWRVPGYGNLGYSRSRVGEDGAYHYPNGEYREDEPARFFYQIYRDGELTSDTLHVPYYPGMEAQRSAHYRLSERGGQMVDGLNHVPFAAVPSWDITIRGTVLSTDGLTPEVLESDLARDTLRVLRLDAGETRQVPADERSDSLRALEARIDSLPVRLEDVMNLGEGVAERRLPDSLPFALSIHATPDGLIWVQRWPDEGEGDSRFYDLYDAGGARLASLELRAPLLAEPSPAIGRRAVVGVTMDEPTGVHRVVYFSLEELLRRQVLH